MLPIKNYHPLDLAKDAIWMPMPHGSAGSITDLGYEPIVALEAWGVHPVRRASGESIKHPVDPSVEKFTLPDGWSICSRFGVGLV